MRPTQGAVVAALFCGGLVALSAATVHADPIKKAAVLTGFDALVPAGSAKAKVRFKVRRDSASPYDLKGVKVEFRAKGSSLGTAVTDARGYAELSVSVPASPTDLLVTGRIAAASFVGALDSTNSVTYVASDAFLLLAVRDAARRMLVTDIDMTISALPWAQVVALPIEQLPPVPGAPRGLSDIAKDCSVVYITGRDWTYTAKSKNWLTHWKFPRGPVLLRDEGDKANNYDQRSRVLEQLQPLFPKLLYGFGNRTTDAEVFDDHGLTPYIFHTQEPGPYPSYSVVAKDWDALRAMNAAGTAKDLGWATKFR
ncbi:MAG: hypothetical protein ACAI25_18025 [Planctomycetota bacterium]